MINSLSIYNSISQDGIDGIRFDFCDGLRVQLPDNGRKYRVSMTDMDSGIVHYNEVVDPGTCIASKVKFLVRWQLSVFDTENDTLLLHHNFNLAEKNVLVICDGALGDMIAWFSVCPEFQNRTGCKLSVLMKPELASVFKNDYPYIDFVTPDDIKWNKFYAAYRLGVWFGDDALEHCPRMWYNTPLHEQAAAILGVGGYIPPLHFDSIKPHCNGRKYVCIATKASAQCKMWNNRFGWDETIEYLQRCGYDVCCIDKYPEYGAGIVMNEMPKGCEDWTGDVSLRERVAQIKGADFFVGLPSGLSWLAWACGKPVIMISGFSEPCGEFRTPYRVQNTRVCHGCWNDPLTKFDHKDFFWCPRKANIGEKYECTRAITSRMVNKEIGRLIEDLSSEW